MHSNATDDFPTPHGPVRITTSGESRIACRIRDWRCEVERRARHSTTQRATTRVAPTAVVFVGRRSRSRAEIEGNRTTQRAITRIAPTAAVFVGRGTRSRVAVRATPGGRPYGN